MRTNVPNASNRLQKVRGPSGDTSSRHDGIKLPRSFRQQGYRTDVIDGTDLASCRMYVGASEVINGVLKNAREGRPIQD